MNILVITGPPYSGKGTQCRFLVEMLGFKHVSTGDAIRLEKENQTEIGKIMSAYAEKGDLVPDAIMKDLFGKIADDNKREKGIILDGYPRTIPQVDDLIALVEERNKKIRLILNIDVAQEELLVRAKRRAKTSDRVDDKNSKTHLKRIDIFEASTRPAIEYMQSKLKVVTVDGMGSIEATAKHIKEVVEKYFI